MIIESVKALAQSDEKPDGPLVAIFEFLDGGDLRVLLWQNVDPFLWANWRREARVRFRIGDSTFDETDEFRGLVEATRGRPLLRVSGPDARIELQGGIEIVPFLHFEDPTLDHRQSRTIVRFESDQRIDGLSG